MQSLKNWTRIERGGKPIYINGDKPDWFVPGEKAEKLLGIFKGKGPCESGLLNDADTLRHALLWSQLESPTPAPYKGRSQVLSLASLKECWFHLTDACNLACRHCLFAASPAKKRMLSRLELQNAVAQARGLGCTLFYFTGGEPFVYPHFVEILGELLHGDAAAHAVVLTNGLLLEKNTEALQKLPLERLHVQVSLDGLEKSHDALRGRGAFAGLMVNLAALRSAHIPVTLSVAVNRENINDLPGIVDVASLQGVSNIHLLWHFVRGKGSDAQFVPPQEIWQHLEPVLGYASVKNVVIDNVETIKAQVFSTPGTRHDLSNSGWESLAIGPDGMIYPSPALVGIATLSCGSIAQGLDEVWRNSPVLQEVRKASIVGSDYEKNPLRFLVGGGDIDHSFISSGKFSGNDPYVELYNNIALWLIARQAGTYPESEQGGGLLLKMGDVRYDCPDGQEVALTHCNCVISLIDDNGHASVREFYGNAANAANEDIVNPFAPAQAEADFIPAVSRKRSYGCGSPVHDAQVKSGETLVDLGSGSGVECFIAAEMVGPQGRVYGIDMTDAMLDLARASQKQVAEELGHDRIEFKKGYLEAIPLEDNTAHVVISNCVINLSPDKRQTLLEAFRVLKPGGRLVVSDIVTDGPVPVAMKNDEKLRGECLGGAMQQEDLMAMLRGAGFTAMKLIKRFPYRIIGDMPFYSLTFAAYKPDREEEIDIIYRGPFAGVYTEQGRLLLKGKRTTLFFSDVAALGDSVFVVDQSGAVTNIDQGVGGCCALPSESIKKDDNSCCPATPEEFSRPVDRIKDKAVKNKETRQHSDCLVCGGELRYSTTEKIIGCYYCGEDKLSNAVCHSGHFVCDGCHQHKGVAQIKKICTEAAIEDMITLMKKIRSKPAIAMHGPEHHAMVPGIILSSYRARGGKVGKKHILMAIDRGSRVPGGVCGFWGSCGAAIGAGIAFSVILEATPLTPKNRQLAQKVTAGILARIASYQAGRCCQRETLLALREVARLSEDILPVSLLASDSLHCSQYHSNRECIRKACPYWDTRDLSMAICQPLALVI